MALVRFIFFLLVFYLFFRLLGRYILPAIVSLYVKRQKKRYYRQNPEADPEGKEGDIHIRRAAQRKPRVNADAAEYVDFEEIEDN